jgi:cellulose synthase/poly-beta-1,6-N-acetylglucosamine synthase-like glycosyltransferase
MIYFEILFWGAVLFILHTYLFFPLILYVLAKRKTFDVSMDSTYVLPKISIVISVFNEENTILEKIKNLQQIHYPGSTIEFIFGSDGSTDSTVELLQQSKDPRLKIMSFLERRGKATVLNDLLEAATGDIIVFTDANTEFEPQTVQMMVRHFQDLTVGAVSGHLILCPPKKQKMTGEHSYWAFENKIKALESTTCSLLGATGGVYAIRKSLFTPLPSKISVADDFLIPMNIVKQGYRCAFEPNAIAYEELESSVLGEYKRKVRIGAQNFNVLPYIASLLHPKYGLISFALWSHKILRWFVPFLLLVITVLLPLLSENSGFYQWIFIGWISFVTVAAAGYFADRIKINFGYFGYPYYYLAMNAALLVGFFRSIFNLQKPTWNVLR